MLLISSLRNSLPLLLGALVAAACAVSPVSAQTVDLDREIVKIRDQVLAEELPVPTAIAQLKAMRQKHPTYPRVHIYLAKFDPDGRDESLKRILDHTKAFPKTAFLVEREFALQNPEMMPRLVELLDTDRYSFAVQALSVDLNRSLETIEQLYDSESGNEIQRRDRQVRLFTAIQEAFVPPELREQVDQLLQRGMASKDPKVRFSALTPWISGKKSLDDTAWASIEPLFHSFEPAERAYFVRTAARMEETAHVKSLIRLALQDKDYDVWHTALAAGIPRLPYSELREHLLAALDHAHPSTDAAWHFVRKPQSEATPKLKSALERTRERGRPQMIAVFALAVARCDGEQLPQMLEDIRPLFQVSRRYVSSRRDVITWLATFGERAAPVATDLQKLAKEQPRCYSNVAIALALQQLLPQQPEAAWSILRKLLKSPRPTSRMPDELPFAVTLDPIAKDVLTAVRTQPVNTLYLCRDLAPFLHAQEPFDVAMRDRLNMEIEQKSRTELLSPEGKLIQSWLEEDERQREQAAK